MSSERSYDLGVLMSVQNEEAILSGSIQIDDMRKE